MASEDFDIIQLTETWLCDDIQSGDLFDDRYLVYRTDRDSSTSVLKRGGGVLIAIKKSISSVLINTDDLELECLFISVELKFRKKLLLCVIYFPPSSSHDAYIKFFNYFVRFSSYENIFVCGDFNLSIFEDCNRHSYLDHKVSELHNFMCLYNLNQFNNVPNINKKYLDLILCNIQSCDISVVHFDKPLVTEDKHHPTLCIVVNFSTDRNKYQYPKVQKFDYKRADFLTMWNLIVSIDWNFLNAFNDVNLAVSCFYDYLYQIFSMTIPLRTINKKFPFWYSNITKKLIREKCKVRRLALRSGDPVILEEFRSLRSLIKLNLKKDYASHIRNTEVNLNSDPKRFWSYFRAANSVPAMLHHGDIIYDEDKDIANAFASYFGSVYRPSTDFDSSFGVNDSGLCDMVKIDSITHDDVILATKKLKSSLSLGVDQIPSFIVKGCTEGLVYPLLILFNLSLKLNTFPEIWKHTKIIPVFKKGDVTDCKNYRPISILSPFSKIFEIIIYKKLFPQIKNLISPSQHGFFPKRSTLTNLYCLTNSIISAFKSDCQLDVIYTDFSKAFDTIDFGILLKKLLKIGFHTSLIDWFHSYLSDRKLFVFFNSAISDEFSNCSGVPQGSNLGPLLFNLFINDLCDIFNFSNCLLFADDLKLYRIIKSNIDVDFLQKDIDQLYQWCIENKLALNISKCSCMSYTHKLQPLNFSYKINNVNLTRTDVIRDLGVTFDTRLDFSCHIDQIVSKSYKILGLLKRKTAQFTDLKVINTLYVSLVRSNMEYCSIIWDPFYENKVKILERVQFKFTLYLYYKKYNSSSEYLSSTFLRTLFKIPSLKSRRELTCVLFFFKVLNGDIDCCDILSCISFYVPNRSLRDRPLFRIFPHKYNYVENFCLFKFYKIFNNVQDDIDIFFMSYANFKKMCLLNILSY